MMFDLNKYVDYGLLTYNLVDYHRYLAAISSNNPNLVSPANALDPMSPLIPIGLNLPANGRNVPQTPIPPGLPSLSSNLPTGLLAVTPTMPPNGSNLFVSANDYLNQSLANYPINVNQCCKCKCNYTTEPNHHEQQVVVNNNKPSTSVSASGATSANNSNLSSSYESSTGERMSYSSDDRTTVKANTPATSTTVKAPRAIRKTNDAMMKESTTRTFEQELNGRLNRLNIETLLPKLLVRTEKIFQKYCNDIRK